ncbi:hypothetical protein G7046_g9162 [Stylonectria norvegica]|nr:hypothetical protein G7046_g9162 [Stylonectria norvegica]
MAPTLDLSHSTHQKLLVAPSRLNLRRAGSYNHADRGPLSSTSSRFNFNHLLFSPPPSPALPSLVPRRRSSSRILVARPSRVLRRLVYLTILLTLLYLLGLALQNPDAIPAAWPYFAKEEFEMVGQDAVPDFPTPIVITDRKGHSKWTVSIPPDYDFPLSIDEYANMGSQCREVSERARDLHHKTPLSEQTILSYDTPDDSFVDVYEAERTGLLPSSGKGIPAKDGGNFAGIEKASMAKRHVCQSTMTFVLESPAAGLGNTLMMLWTFYGLAKKQNRAFFIDDTRWAYGTYTDMFKGPPVPNCRPPPRHQMVPCPFQARHLVVTALTAKEVFPALLAKNHRISGTDNGLWDLFELARVGQQSLLALTQEDQDYVDKRVRELETKAKGGATMSHDAPIIGLHIRHGDQHPLEYQYRESYIPGEIFLETTRHLVESHYNGSEPDEAKRHAITVLASDDPTVHEEPAFSSTILAQRRIRLASKVAMEEANPNPQLLHHFVDETFGWEGGFFAALFWNLGVQRKNNAANAPAGVAVDYANEEERHTAAPSAQTLQLRSFIGRAYMMDLAVLAGASDKVVCAVSAMGCRMLAVMMGWENAIEAAAPRPSSTILPPPPAASAAPPSATPTTDGARKVKLKVPTKSQPPTPAVEQPPAKTKAGRQTKPTQKLVESKKRPHDDLDDEELSAAHITTKIKLKASLKHQQTPGMTVVVKPKGRIPVRPPGDGYDSEASDRERDPSIEEQFILRMMPGERLDYLRYCLENGKIGMPRSLGGVDFHMKFFEEETRRALVSVKGQAYAAVMVDLPTVTEAMKTWDRKSFLKSADICQMLLVFQEVANEAEARQAPLPSMIDSHFKWPHGLTPPMHDCANRRFAKTISRKEIEDKEAEVERLLADDAKAASTRWEWVDEQKPQGYDDDLDLDQDAEGEEDYSPGQDMFGDAGGENDDGGLEADLEAAFADDLLAETPATGADMAMTPLTTTQANTPAALLHDSIEADESEDVSDDDDDVSDDEDLDDDVRARREEEQGVRDIIADLERQLANRQAELARNSNKILRARLETQIKQLKSEIELKKSSIGIDLDD